MKSFYRIVLLVAVVVVLLTLKLSSDGKYIHNVFAMIQYGDDFNKQRFEIQADRWVIVDAVNISNKDILEIQDVNNWRLLVFGQHIRFFVNRRCQDCIFLNRPQELNLKPTLPVALNIKMAAYMYAVGRGAMWIYSTSDVRNLEDRLQGYHTTKIYNGILYTGELPFDPDRHYGIKDTSNDVHRKTYASYRLGEYPTPSIQTIWRPPQNRSQYDVDDVSCRLPGAIIPAARFPGTDLSDSLVGRRSFWTLGSFLGSSNSSRWTPWWLWLLSYLNETIGMYPSSCSSRIIDATHRRHVVQEDLAVFKCKPGCKFQDCALDLARTMLKRKLLSKSDVDKLDIWLRVLVSLNIKEPKRRITMTEPLKDTYRFIYEPSAKRLLETYTSPFKKLCRKTTPKSGTSSLQVTKDILLIVIFNYPTYYSNVIHLNYIYRKYFTHIVYCGGLMSLFDKTYVRYTHPINFLEMNDINKGMYSYICSAYAMQLGYKVSGYLQISDDVLLNAWTISALPRARPWFQKSIRKGSLNSNNVPNITPAKNDRHWWPWSNPNWGVARLRLLMEYIEALKTPVEKSMVEKFTSQLWKSFKFGNVSGGFYEASDIFYVPAKYTEGFIFFSKVSFLHGLFLEIAIPTMLCGLGDVSDIVHLNGTYLWYKERRLYKQMYNPSHHFLHPVKLNDFIKNKKGIHFYCTHYLTHIEAVAGA